VKGKKEKETFDPLEGEKGRDFALTLREKRIFEERKKAWRRGRLGLDSRSKAIK